MPSEVAKPAMAAFDEEPQVSPETPPLGSPTTTSRSSTPSIQSPEILEAGVAAAVSTAREKVEISDSSSDSSIAWDARTPSGKKRPLECGSAHETPTPKRSQRLKKNLEAKAKAAETGSPPRPRPKRLLLRPSRSQTPTSEQQAEMEEAAVELRKKNTELKLQINAIETKQYNEMVELQGRLLGSRSEIGVLESSLSSLKEKNRQLQQFNDKLRTTVARIEEEKYRFNNPGPKVSDDVIQQKWHMLASDIQNFVLQLVNQSPAKKTRREKVATRWGDELPALRLKWYKYASKQMSHFWVQQYIWTRIDIDIFRCGAAAWGVEIGSLFQTYFDRFGGVLTFPMNTAMPSILLLTNALAVDFSIKEEFSTYKSRLGYALAKARDGDDGGTMSRLARELQKELFVFTTPGKDAEFLQRINQILNQAVDLQVIFMTSRAFFVPRQVPPNSPLDQDEVEVRFVHGDGMDVDAKLDIVISPMIEKVGNADGYRFDARYVVCKAFVTTRQV